MPTNVVTGSNRGIGLELCRQLAGRGDTVIAVCRKPSPELEALQRGAAGVRIEDDVDVTDAASVDDLARRHGIELSRRLPSRAPRERDVVEALLATRHKNGAPNKTRASAYLGWDPDTLVARMADLGLDGEALGALPSDGPGVA